MSLLRSYIVFCLVAMTSFSVTATTLPNVKADAPVRYIVQSGDTLWDIAELYLTEAWHWPQIWAVNPDISNPHLIYPGDELRLIETEDGYKVQLQRADRAKGNRTKEAASNAIKLTPSIRSSAKRSAIPAIASDDIAQWLGRLRVVANDDYERAPYIVAGNDGRLLLKPGDLIYSTQDVALPASSYRIYQFGQTYRHPKSGKALGTELLEVGQAKKVSDSGALPKLEITSAKKEISPGNRLMISEERALDPTLFPRRNRSNLRGEIIGLPDRTTLAAVRAVVTINLGQKNGLVTGDLLEITQAGSRVTDPIAGQEMRLPDRAVGNLLVYQVYEQIAYGLIISADEAVNVGDGVQSFP